MTWDPERGNLIGDEEALRIHRAAAARGGTKVKVAERPPLVIPPPEVPAHIITWTQKTWPQGMRTIGNLAARQGFSVVGSHARGPYIGDVPLQVMRICDSVLLRMRHDDGRRASALWMTDNHGDWGLECMFLLTPWLQQVKSATFKDYLKTPRDPEEPTTVPEQAPVDLAAFDVGDSA